MNGDISGILGEYDAAHSLYSDFAYECESLIKRLLTVKGYQVHSVTSRLKERSKVEEKLKREGKEYQKLSDMTDVVGVRVITHFEDEVDRIGTLVEEEFDIDRGRSVDKRQLLEADRFGYLSLHYVCSLNGHRLKLAENNRYARLPCEVQIRTILQHAWAEIEHDLGYKPGNTVPKPVRRRFSRLAGLLEIGDQEFRSIRDELREYEDHVLEEIKAKPSQVEIDDLSLKAFARGDAQYRELVSAMAMSSKLRLTSAEADFKRYATELRSVGLTTIDELRDALTANKHLALCQFTKRTRVKKALARYSDFPDGIGFMHLIQVLVAKSGGVQALLDFFLRHGYQVTEGTNEDTALEIVSAVKSCSNTG